MGVSRTLCIAASQDVNVLHKMLWLKALFGEIQQKLHGLQVLRILSVPSEVLQSEGKIHSQNSNVEIHMSSL
jgi:hypothetical protein